RAAIYCRHSRGSVNPLSLHDQIKVTGFRVSRCARPRDDDKGLRFPEPEPEPEPSPSPSPELQPPVPVALSTSGNATVSSSTSPSLLRSTLICTASAPTCTYLRITSSSSLRSSGR